MYAFCRQTFFCWRGKSYSNILFDSLCARQHLIPFTIVSNDDRQMRLILCLIRTESYLLPLGTFRPLNSVVICWAHRNWQWASQDEQVELLRLRPAASTLSVAKDFAASITAETSEHAGACPCALVGRPPPRPPHTSKVARIQSSAFKW